MRLIALVALLTCSWPGQPPAVGVLKSTDLEVHDPYVLADLASRTYCLYAAAHVGQNRWGVVAYTSKDLVSWQKPRDVFAVPDGLWANPADGLRAPEVHAYRGKYYLFATLMNNASVIEKPPQSWRTVTRRGTQIFVGESALGPFRPAGTGPASPEDFSALDGTLYVEDGVPYMVYAHEWVQTIDGAIEAIRLADDLSGAVGEPLHLFKASDAPWLADQFQASKQPRHYAAEGPCLYRTRAGTLLMLWSSWKDGLYSETVASSASGKLRGPWRQLDPLFTDDTGHGTIVRTFDGRLVLVAHSPTMSPLTRVVFHRLEDMGDRVSVKRAR